MGDKGGLIWCHYSAGVGGDNWNLLVETIQIKYITHKLLIVKIHACMVLTMNNMTNNFSYMRIKNLYKSILNHNQFETNHIISKTTIK